LPRTFLEILAVEDDARLVEFKTSEGRFLLWPLVRNWVLRSLIEAQLNVPWTRTESDRRRPVGFATAVARSLLHNAAKGKTSGSVMVMGSGAGNILENGLIFNRLSDHFISTAPDITIAVEDLFGVEWPFPRKNEAVLLSSPFEVQAAVMARVLVRPRHTRQAAELLDFVSARTRTILQWDFTAIQRNSLVNTLARQIAGIKSRAAIYERLLRRTGVRLLLKEEGCYGHASVINVVAREMGVTVAEFQHGTIHVGHDAYNFAPALRFNEEYARSLPEYLLTYGRWWSHNVNASVTTEIIGNPHRTEHLRRIQPDAEPGRDILILGDGVRSGEYLEFAARLSRGSGGSRRIIYRPHPLERHEFTSSRKSSLPQGVVIDANRDLYTTFQTADVVIGEASTALFEAIGIVRRILIWDTPMSRFCYPQHPFQSFSTLDNLVEGLRDETYGEVASTDIEDMWATDWRSRYLNFISRFSDQ